MTAVVVVEAAALLLLGVLVFSLLRTQARIVAAMRAGSSFADSPVAASPVPVHPNPGSSSGARDDPAPGLSGVDLDGRPTHWDAQGPAVLAFLTSGCSSCGWWWTQLRSAGRLALPAMVVVTPDPETDSPTEVRPLAGPQLRVIMSSDGWAAYEVRAGSTFVVVDGGRIQASGTASDWDGLMALVGTGLSE